MNATQKLDGINGSILFLLLLLLLAILTIDDQLLQKSMY
jgi:hypothetical protein